MSNTPSYVIEAGGAGKTGSLKITVNSNAPYYLNNLRTIRVKGTGNNGSEATLVLILPDDQKIIFSYSQITTIGGVSPVSLTDAVNKISAILAHSNTLLNPNLQINAINTMAVGDADQLLGYTSLSAGAVTFASSDLTIATIVVSGGNSYLHAVAFGSVTVTASQVANGSYASATSPGTGTIVQLVSSGLVFRDKFSDLSTQVLVSGKVSQITDTIGGLVHSQGNAAIRPISTASGGANNKPYASFGTNSVQYNVSGSLVPALGDFTQFLVKRVKTNPVDDFNAIVFQNGQGDTGYAWADLISGNDLCSGGFYPTKGQVVSDRLYTSQSNANRWELGVLSHSTGSNKTYNAAGTLFTPVPSGDTANPTTPLTSSRIGGTNGATGCYWLIGDLEDVLVYNRQLSDAEVLQNCNYLTYYYALPLPNNLITVGDSIMAGVGQLPNCPQEVVTQLLPTKYVYVNNNAVPGWLSQDVLTNIQTVAINYYNSKVKNICTVMVGHNDIILSVSISQYIANITAIVNDLVAANITPIICTILRSTAFSNSTVDSYNNPLRAYCATNSITLADVNLAPNLQDPTNFTYFSDGATHLTTLGSQQMTNIVLPLTSALLP